MNQISKSLIIKSFGGTSTIPKDLIAQHALTPDRLVALSGLSKKTLELVEKELSPENHGSSYDYFKRFLHRKFLGYFSFVDSDISRAKVGSRG